LVINRRAVLCSTTPKKIKTALRTHPSKTIHPSTRTKEEHQAVSIATTSKKPDTNQWALWKNSRSLSLDLSHQTNGLAWLIESFKAYTTGFERWFYYSTVELFKA